MRCAIAARKTLALDMNPVDTFVFDLDGTVTEEELLPRIAAAVGETEAIADLTRRTIAGHVPFESSLRERVAILGKAPIAKVAEIVEGVSLNPTILSFLEANASRSIIITGNLDVWLTKLALRLPVPILSSRVTSKNGYIENFSEIMEKGAKARMLHAEQLCVVGDGHNDLGMFEIADVAIAYGGVHEPAASLYAAATHAVYDPNTLCRLISQL